MNTWSSAARESVFLLRDVCFAYHAAFRGSNSADVIKNISFGVQNGESLGIVGESGSGKTTLLSLLLRLSFARNGSVSFYGKDIKSMTHNEVRDFRKKVQPVFQDPFLSLDPSQRVEDIIGEPLVSLKLVSGAEKKRERVVAALESVGFGDDILRRRPAEFSGGQRQRIAIARALVTAPQVLIADEPVSALDIVTKIEILNLLRSLQQNNNFTLIMVSHDLPVVADICSRLIVLDAGKIAQDAPIREALSNPAPRTRALVEAVIPL